MHSGIIGVIVPRLRNTLRGILTGWPSQLQVNPHVLKANAIVDWPAGLYGRVNTLRAPNIVTFAPLLSSRFHVMRTNAIVASAPALAANRTNGVLSTNTVASLGFTLSGAHS